MPEMKIITDTPETEALDQFVRGFQGKFSFSPFMGMSSRAPTGEPYIVYSMAGVKQEGLPYPEQCKSAMDAVENFIDTLNKEFPAQDNKHTDLNYESVKSALDIYENRKTLYWRRFPELILNEAYDGPCPICSPEGHPECDFNGCINGHIKHPDLYVVRARFLISDKPVVPELVQGRDIPPPMPIKTSHEIIKDVLEVTNAD